MERLGKGHLERDGGKDFVIDTHMLLVILHDKECTVQRSSYELMSTTKLQLISEIQNKSMTT